MKTFLPTFRHGRVSRAGFATSILGVGGALCLMAGCASEPASVVVSAPPPAPPSAAPVYTATPVAQPTGSTVAIPNADGTSTTVVVMQAPPAAQQEVPSARPSTSHVWVGGYWAWRTSQYQWVAGHWEVPPRSGAVWVPPRWQPEGTSYRFFDGRWE